MLKWSQVSCKFYKQFHPLFLNNGSIRNFRGRKKTKSNSNESSAIRIKTVRSRDIASIISLLRSNFPDNEPLVNGLCISKEKLSPGLEELWRMSLSQGMSLIAVTSNETNSRLKKVQEALGTAINVNLCPWDAIMLDKLANNIVDSSTGDLMRLYAIFIRHSEVFKKYKKNKIFSIFQLIVNKNLKSDHKFVMDSNDLAKLLLDLSLQAAEKKGFKAACLICTSERLADLAKSSGMDLIWKYPYAKILDAEFKPLIQWTPPNTHVKVYGHEFK